MPVTTTYSPSLSADVTRYLSDDLLPLTLSELVFYEFSEKRQLPRGRGTTYTMSRYARLPLSYAPTAEGVPPVASPLQISQATVQLQQWTALVTITDVAQATIQHDVFKIAKERLTLAGAELMERNCAFALMAFPQINYVNQRGSRGALTSSDVLNVEELQRAFAILQDLGVPMFRGPSGPKVTKNAGEGQPNALGNPRQQPHYVAVVHPMIQAALRSNQQVQLISSYSSPNRLYNGEFGEWNSIRFCSSNMVPYFTGLAAVTGTGSITGGTLAAGNWQIQVTAQDQIFQYERKIYQQSGNINIASGTTGSISVTLPSTPGYLYNVYITPSPGSTTIGNIATCAAGPTQGLMQGQAVQLSPGSTVTLTGVGVSQVPPAAPQTGITVYPTFIFGKDAYATVTLEDIEVNYLDKAEKTDPANQLRMASFKFYNGTFLMNQAFALRIEGTSPFSLTFG